jgi:enoyl-CoA hydratase
VTDAAPVLAEPAGAVLYLTLNRPSRANAMNGALLDAFDAHLEAARRDDDVHVVVVRGAGRGFSAGYDMDKPDDAGDGRHDPLAEYRYDRSLVERWLAVWEFPKPIIAQVHGYCIGSANDIVAIADMIVCGESAQFGMPEARQFALPPTLGFWPFRIGLAKTKELLYTGRFVGGAEAAAIGLATEVVADDSLAAHVDALAATIAEVPSDRLAVVKQAANSWFEVLGLPQAALRGAEYHAIYHQASEWAAQGEQRSPEPS